MAHDPLKVAVVHVRAHTQELHAKLEWVLVGEGAHVQIVDESGTCDRVLCLPDVSHKLHKSMAEVGITYCTYCAYSTNTLQGRQQ